MDPKEFEQIILKLLYTDEKIRNVVTPYLDPDLFSDEEMIRLVGELVKFFEKYEELPSVKDFSVFCRDPETLLTLKECVAYDLSQFTEEFLIDDVEEYFRQKLIYNANQKVFDTIDDPEANASAIEELGVVSTFKFDDDLGTDIFSPDDADIDELYDDIQREDEYVPTGIKTLDDCTNGGVGKKTLYLFLAETNLGKSLIMTSLATEACLAGKKILYVTLEMASKKVAMRVLQNALDMSQKQIKRLSKDEFRARVRAVKSKIDKTLFIKEWPPSTINARTIKNYITECEKKQGFKFDMVFVDYLQLIEPAKRLYNANTNTEMDVISKELRAVAVVCDIPMVSAYQTNRNGMGNAEIDLTNSSSGISTAMNADVIWGVTQTQEMKECGYYTFELLKARDSGYKNTKIKVGVDYSRMRIHDMDQDDIYANSVRSSKDEKSSSSERKSKANVFIKGSGTSVKEKTTSSKGKRKIKFG